MGEEETRREQNEGRDKRESESFFCVSFFFGFARFFFGVRIGKKQTPNNVRFRFVLPPRRPPFLAWVAFGSIIRARRIFFGNFVHHMMDMYYNILQPVVAVESTKFESQHSQPKKGKTSWMFNKFDWYYR